MKANATTSLGMGGGWLGSDEGEQNQRVTENKLLAGNALPRSASSVGCSCSQGKCLFPSLLGFDELAVSTRPNLDSRCQGDELVARHQGSPSRMCSDVIGITPPASPPSLPHSL